MNPADHSDPFADIYAPFASETFGKHFVPLPAAGLSAPAHDLITLATLAWRHRAVSDQVAANALRRAALGYLDALFSGFREGTSSDEALLSLGRAEALHILQSDCSALARPDVAADPQIGQMLASVVQPIVDETAQLLAAARALEAVKREHLRGRSRIRDRLSIGSMLKQAVIAIADLADERTSREVQFAFFEAVDMFDAKNEAEILIERRRSGVALSEDAILLLQGAYACLDGVSRRGWKLSGIGASLFDKDGREVRIDEDAEVARGTEAGMEAWHANHAIRSERGKTSKVHTLGRILSAVEELRQGRRQYLSQSLARGLMTVLKLDSQRLFQPVDALRGDWIVPFVRDYAQRVGPSGLPGLEELQERVQKRLAVALEREILQAGGNLTMQQSFCAQRDGAGFYKLHDVPLPDDPKDTYPFEGGVALLEIGSDESVGGITPCSAELVAWGSDGKFRGMATLKYMRGRKGTRWDKLTRDQYIYIADACDDAWTSMAQALCDELGRAPDRPVAIVSYVERHPTRSSKGFGVALVKEAMRQLRSKHPYISSVAVHVAPSQFDWEDGEAVPAELEVERFQAAQKLKAWVTGDLASGLSELDVHVLATLAKRTVGHDAALEVLAQERQQQRLRDAGR